MSQLIEFIKNRASKPKPKPSTPKLMPKPPGKEPTAPIVVLDVDDDEGVSGKKQQCWNFRNHGKCHFGDECNYAHTETMMDIQRREKKAKEKAAQDASALLNESKKDGKKGAASKKQAAVQQKSPPSFRLQSGKKVDKANVVEGQGDAQPPPARKSKSSQLCKYYENGGCWKGNDCIFRHDDSADGIARRAAYTQPPTQNNGGSAPAQNAPPRLNHDDRFAQMDVRNSPSAGGSHTTGMPPWGKPHTAGMPPWGSQHMIGMMPLGGPYMSGTPPWGPHMPGAPSWGRPQAGMPPWGGAYSTGAPWGACLTGISHWGGPHPSGMSWY